MAQGLCPAGSACSNCVATSCVAGTTFAAGEGNSACSAILRCGAGQRVTTGPTASSDTQCGSCDAGTYQSSTSHLATSCLTPTTCGTGQYVTAAATLTTDRSCGNCDGTTTFQNQINQAACKAVRLCAAGTYVSKPPTPTSDRECSPCTLGTTFQAAHDHTLAACTNVRAICPSGTFQSQAATLTSDRVCQACGPTEWQDNAGQTNCKPQQVCKVGEAQTVAGTPTSDRQCGPCNGVTHYQDEPNQTACKLVSACLSGEYTTTLPTASSNRACASCTASSSCQLSQYLAGSCGGTSNTYCAPCHATCNSCLDGSATSCLTCAGQLVLHNGACTSSCPVGRYADANNVCRNCDATCYACEGAGSTACTACSGERYLVSSLRTCSSSCPAAFYKNAQLNDNRCLPCTVCDVGWWSAVPCGSSTNTQCAEWSTCAVGTAVSQTPSTSTDRLCQACDGTTGYSDSTNLLACKAVRICVSGERVSAAPTPSSNRGCADCSPGHYSSGENQGSCTPCPPGTFSDQAKRTACSACGGGLYQDSEGQVGCKTVLPGFYGIGGTPTTRTGIADCPIGHFCLGGAATPQLCDGLTGYQDEPGMVSCKATRLCHAGQRMSVAPTSSSDRQCTACEAETYRSQPSHAEPTCLETTKCGVGSQQTVAPTLSSDRSCAPCDGATGYADVPGLLACKPVTTCVAGKRVLAPPTPSTDRHCSACEDESFSTAANVPSCTIATTCLAGSFETAAPTPTSDRACTLCTLGSTYQEGTNAKSCVAVRTCGPGERETAAPTLASDRLCAPCPDATFQGLTSHSMTTCVAYTTCAPGAMVTTEGTDRTDVVCTECEAGKFQDVANARTCKPVALCNAGERVSVPPTISSDRECVSCILGQTYQDAENHALENCRQVEACQPGSYEAQAATVVHNAVCAACESGKYQNEVGRGSCKSITACADTEYIVVAATPSSDQQCSACTTRDDCNGAQWLDGVCGGATGASNPICRPCHATCATCSGGLANNCLSCITGLFLEDGGFTCVSDCGMGRYADAGDGTCQDCDASCHACNGALPSQCLQCAGNRYLTPSLHCELSCPVGYWQETLANDNRCSLCQTCPSGQWSSSPCQTAANTVCTTWHTCAAGEETQSAPTSTSDRTCVSCVAGLTFSAAAGAERCTAVRSCFFPDHEGVAPTVTSNRECTCDREGCGTVARNIYLELLCRLPSAGELGLTVEMCCSGTTSSELRAMLRAHTEYDERHSCPGCTTGCGCTAGYISTPLPGGGEVCQACDGVTQYNPLDGQRQCRNVTVCSEGQQEAQPPTQSSNRVCELCPAGTIDDDSSGLTPCVPCALGDTYIPTQGRTACVPTTRCRAGQEELVAASLSTDRVCVACTVGETFKPTAGQDTRCVPVSQCDFPATEWRTTLPTATSDAQCRAITQCNTTTHYRSAAAELDRDAVCTPLTPCAVLTTHYIRVAATPVTDLECAPLTQCQSEEAFEQRGPTPTTDRLCQAYTVCKSTQYDVIKATPTADRTCVDVVVATVYSELPSYSDASGTAVFPWGSGHRRNVVSESEKAAATAAWESVVVAGHAQVVQLLSVVGIPAEAVVLIRVLLVDADGVLLEPWAPSVARHGQVRVEILLTAAVHWYTLMLKVVEGAPGASQVGVDWPLVLEPCALNAYFGSSLAASNDGTVVVECRPRSICHLGVTFAPFRGNRTADRLCISVRDCGPAGEAVPPTLETDRQCATAASSAAAMSGSIFGIIGGVVVLLVLLVVLVRYHRNKLLRERNRSNASFYGGREQIHTSFVNPSFAGFDLTEDKVQRAGIVSNSFYGPDESDNVEGLYADTLGPEVRRMMMLDTKAAGDSMRTAGGRTVMRNPLYEGPLVTDDMGGEYDEVDPANNFGEEDEVSGYLDVSPDEAIEGTLPPPRHHVNPGYFDSRALQHDVNGEEYFDLDAIE